jgi:hypothetical protein
MVRRCDAMLVEPHYGNSEGTAAEIAEAHRIGIPVFKTVDYLRMWLGKKEDRLEAGATAVRSKLVCQAGPTQSKEDLCPTPGMANSE